MSEVIRIVSQLQRHYLIEDLLNCLRPAKLGEDVLHYDSKGFFVVLH